MAKKDYSKDLLIQAPTAELLKKKLGWTSEFAHDEEGFGPESLLGRTSDREVVLTREVNAEAQYNLGLMYRDCEGVTKDAMKAIEWFENAASQGHAKAKFILNL